MAKQLNVNLAFTADTGKARAELQSLQKQLSDLTKVNSTSSFENGFTQNIQEAARAAAQLKSQLDAAVDVNTGRLDLSKFNSSLKNSGMSLEKYKNLLVSLGPAGEKAFISLASSIQSADVPMRKVSSYLAELKTTLANTARWQISSSILHGFMGAVSTAYGYAQDLNESLNNIRIVTGYSADEMAKFAEEANKAAKALSTTTTEYTNASLIYYQQGLSAEEVQKRTEVTVKMANVARQSAEVVSDQMTAIWNNFYDGTKSLEYYADVMTALGAKTASSTDEIAGGLEKFAAIGNTIGLSYEYAASALATITSNTRQSEEVVGTALKTIFARIQGLNLGETLDDGTTLNKYSEALEKVGISIFNSTGELKTMDAILDEMGSKWESLNAAQQTALAQTVAGVRQYTQLIALMENWNNGDNDSFQANLTTIDSSSGALENQHEIYAEGWEAARDRVKAALEGIYQDLLDDDVFITILDGFEKIFSTVDKAIDMMGGLKGVIAALGTVLLHTFSKELSASLTNFGANIMKVSGQAETAAAKMKRDAALMVGNMVQDSDTQQGYATQTAYQAQSDAQLAIINNAERMNDIEKNTVQLMLDGVKALGDQAIAQGRIADEAQRTVDNQIREFGRTQNRAGVQISEQELTSYTSTLSAFGGMESGIQKISTTLSNSLKNFNADAITSGQILYNSFNSALERFDTNLDMIPEEARTKFSMLSDAIREKMTSLRSEDGKTFEGSKEDLEAMLRDAQQLLEMVRRTGDEYQGNFVTEKTMPNSSQETHLNNMANAARTVGEESERASQQMDGLADSADGVVDAAENSKGKISDLSGQLVSAATAISTAAMAFSMLSSLIDTLSNPDATPWERISAVLTTLPIIIVQTISAFKALQAAKLKDTTTNLLNAAAEIYLAKTKRDTAKASKESATATSAEIPAQTADTASNVTEAASEEALAKAKKKNGKISPKSGKTPTAPTGSGAENGVRSIGQSLSTLAPAIASIGIAIAAIAGAIAIYQAVEDWWNKNTIAAENARNAADAAAEGYNNLKIAHDNLTNSFNNYEQEIEGLDALTKGTLEYEKALLSANDAAFDLINNYEGLTYTINADGLVEIDKDSLEAVQTEQLKALQELQFLKQQAEADAKQAEAIAKRTEFLREDIKTQEAFMSEDTGRAAGNGTAIGLGAGAAVGAGVALSGALAGTKFGMALGSFAGPVGTAIGAAAGAVIGVAVGAAVGAAIKESETERETAAMDKLVAAYKIEGESVFADGRLEQILGDGNKELAKALRANEQETRKLVRETATANSLMAEANRRAVTERYGDLFNDVANKNEQQAAIALSGQYLEKLTNQLKTAYEDKGKFGSGLTDKEIGTAYAALRAAKGEDIEFIKTKGGNKGLYRIGDKEESLSDDAARNALAVDIAQQILSGGDIVETYGISKDKLIELAKEAGVAFGTNFIDVAKKDVDNLNDTTFGNEILTYFGAGENTQALSTNFINAIKNEVIATNYGRYRDYESGRNAYIIDQLGGEEAAKQFAQQYFGTDDIEMVLDSLFNAINISLDDIKEKTSKKLTSTTEAIFNDLVDNTSNKIAIGELENVADQIEQAFIMGGEDSAKAIADLYLALGDEADEFNTEIKNIDWDTIDIRSFRSTLQDAGVDLSNVDSALLNTCIQLGRFTTSLTTTADQLYAAYQKLSGKMYGDVISEEDWIDIPEELKQFYSAAAGGGYRLTDDVGYHQYLVHSGQINSYATNNGLKLTEAQEDWLRTTATVDDPMAVSDLVNGVLQYQDLSSKYFEFFKFVDEAQQQLTEDEITKLESLEKEFAEGTATETDVAELFTIFKEIYQSINFNYYTYLNDLSKENEERMADAALQAELDRANITWEEYDKYGQTISGIAQARFERSINTLVSEYEKALDDDNNFTGIRVNELSVSGWKNLQTALADVLNLSVDQISREYAQLLIDNGTFAELVNKDGSWQQAITTARQQAVTNAQNDIISLVNNCSDIAGDTLDGIKSDIIFAGLITTEEEAQTAANELNTKIGEVIEGGVSTIIEFFEKMGWITHLDENGNIVVDGRTGVATLFGSDFSFTGTAKETKAPKLKEAFEVDDDQFKSLDEEVERYHEINNELEVLADNLNAISKEKDRAYGANRVKLIDQEAAALKQQLSVQERYIDKIEDYLAGDRAKIDKYGFMFNEDADIINYDEVMDQQIQAYNAAYQAYIAAKNAAIEAFNAAVQSGTSEEDAEKIYDAAIKAADATWGAAQERYTTFEKELQQYEKSVDLLRQQKQVLQDIKYQIQDLNYEKIQYKLEVKMKINDAEMRMLDYYLNKLSDDLYSVAEAMTILTDEKIPLLNNALSSYGTFVDDLKSAYDAGEISMADYQEGLSAASDGIYSNIEALQELDEQMMNYYGETLSMAQEELDKYNSLMEHSASVLDHYYNIVKMINGESDYENLNIILQGQADVAKNQMEVTKATYEMYKGQEEYWRSQRDSVAEGTDAWNLYNDYMLQTAESAAEAEEEMLAATETWAQKMKDIMVNTFEKSKWDVEKSLTRGIGFDNLMSSMDRLSSLSDEYLTKTNQIYEMQTIQNKLQKEIDKTSNIAAKDRLKNFKQDTAKLQEKNQLSKYELELHQAKYDVLLAEIALEEAQNAKSTVRLQRDNEGNFGYVYTADANKVADAEQNLLDARNKEYNISLEAANDYAQKIIETQQQMYDDLNALYEEYAINGRYTEEEYNQIKEQIISEYNEKFKAYSINYTLALAHDTNVQKDAWTNAYQDIVAQTAKAYDDIIAKEISTYTQMSEESNIAYTNLQTDAMNAYASMTQSSTDWSTAVTEHLDTCEQAYTDWRTTISTENETIQKLLGDVKGSVDTVTTANTLLRDTIVDSVVPKVESALSAVASATTNYMSNIRQQVLDTIAEYEALIRTILEYQRTLAASKGPGDQTPPNTDLSDFGDTGGGGNTGGAPGSNIGHNEMAQLVQDIMVHGSYQNDPVRTQMILNAGYTAEQRADAQAIVNDLAKNETNAWYTGQGWEDALDKYITKYGYNTGGYTGSWGPDGRLGVLHQKEIVLNSDDTENFLAAVNLVRDITKMIDLEVMRNQMSAMSAIAFGNGFGQGGTLDQNVHIEASFPNVQDHREIEEAINNLINTASQFAYRQ